MKALAPALACLLAPASCAPLPPRPSGVTTGLEVLRETGFQVLQGKRLGLITNQTGKDRTGRSTVEVLAQAPGLTLAAVFSPEHGFKGTSEEHAVSSTTLLLAGREIPIHSLYSGGITGMRPKPEDLKGLDALVFDIQDIGARFYTYLATMGMALEEAAKAGIEFIVLDRPNPINGTTIEGPILEDLSLRQVTATAYFPVPIRHGMTAGEIALLHNSEVRHPGLKVVRMRGWSRGMFYDQTGLPWVPPSPNMPDLEAAALYPGIAIFEASNLSVGRGTPLPFRWVGAPWLDAETVLERMEKARLPGVAFSLQDYAPTKSAYAGKSCRGVLIRVTDRESLRPVRVFLELHQAVRSLHAERFEWRWDEVKRMVGTTEFQSLVEAGAGVSELQSLFERGASEFARSRKPFLLY